MRLEKRPRCSNQIVCQRETVQMRLEKCPRWLNHILVNKIGFGSNSKGPRFNSLADRKISAFNCKLSGLSDNPWINAEVSGEKAHPASGDSDFTLALCMKKWSAWWNVMILRSHLESLEGYSWPDFKHNHGSYNIYRNSSEKALVQQHALGWRAAAVWPANQHQPPNFDKNPA